MDPKALEEFHFKFGDPRTHLFHYALGLGKYVSCVRSTKNSANMFGFRCMKKAPVEGNQGIPGIPPKKQKAVKTWVFPKDKSLDFKLVPSAPLMMIPILLRSSTRCAYSNTARHMNFLVYNWNTNELERIDIKKYHVDGFMFKTLVKKIQSEFVPYLAERIGKSPDYIPDIDVPYAFAKKTPGGTARDAYPLFVVAYLHTRNEYPTLTSEDIYKRIRALSPKQIAAYWGSYTKFRETIAAKDDPCPHDHVKNQATSRCMANLSKAFVSNLIDKPLPKCSDGLVLNQLTRKCTTPAKLFDVNILLDEVSQSKLTNKTEFTQIDDAEVALKCALFVLGQFPYAYMIYPRDAPIKSIKKTSYRIMWRGDKASADSFTFSLPPNFWDMWADGMNDPTIRFVVCFVSLNGKTGAHANVIIYDKSTNELERFDPHGRLQIQSYQLPTLDVRLKKAFEESPVIPKSGKRPFKFFSPLDYCPKVEVFQAKEQDDLPGIDLRGNCAVWRLWYVHARLANPKLTRKKLTEYAAKKMQQVGSLHNFIKSYQLYVLQNIRKRAPRKAPVATRTP
jgi:hypothetical protein